MTDSHTLSTADQFPEYNFKPEFSDKLDELIDATGRAMGRRFDKGMFVFLGSCWNYRLPGGNVTEEFITLERPTPKGLEHYLFSRDELQVSIDRADTESIDWRAPVNDETELVFSAITNLILLHNEQNGIVKS